ncbi:hypothetical protein [uncultured Algibacter sp.]|uniref:hypothetical protein n=1 Tax=uncultured Algibacter sp. TaxID=298659 RepID=UPI0032171BD8
MSKKKKINIYSWLLEGKVLYNINLGDSLQDSLIKIEKEEYNLVGEDNYGYYYLDNGYRFGFSNGIIDEIGIDFLQSRQKTWFIGKDGFKVNLDKGKIHKVLDFLNSLFVKWKPIESTDSRALIYKLDEFDIFLIFDIYEGTLEKITKSNPVPANL